MRGEQGWMGIARYFSEGGSGLLENVGGTDVHLRQSDKHGDVESTGDRDVFTGHQLHTHITISFRVRRREKERCMAHLPTTKRA